MEQFKVENKEGGFWTKKSRIVKILLITFLILLCTVGGIAIVIYIWKRSQTEIIADSHSSDQEVTSPDNDPNRGKLLNRIPGKNPILDSLEIPPLEQGINDLILDQIKEPIVGEMSMLLVAEYVLNPQKCHNTPSDEQLSQFVPATGRSNELHVGSGLEVRMDWIEPFINNTSHNSPAELIEHYRHIFTNPRYTNQLINALEINFPPLRRHTEVSPDSLTLSDVHFRPMLTRFFDAKILLSLEAELTLANDKDVKKILKQAILILNYRKRLSSDDYNRLIRPQQILTPLEDLLQLDWQLWKNFCDWDTQRLILHTFCQVSFGEEELGTFEEQFRNIIKLPRASPWIIYLTWMSMIFHAKEQAALIQKHHMLPQVAVLALQQCYNQIVDNNEIKVNEVLQCLEHVPDPYTNNYGADYLHRSILSRAPLWPRTIMGEMVAETTDQHIQLLFIAHHLDSNLLPNPLDNSLKIFPSFKIIELIGGSASFYIMEVNGKEFAMTYIVQNLWARYQNLHGGDRLIANLIRIPDWSDRFSGLQTFLSPESNLTCAFPVGLLHMQCEHILAGFNEHENDFVAFPVLLTSIVTKYRTGSVDFDEEERDVMAKIFKSDIYKNYVAYRLTGRKVDDLERLHNDPSYLGSIDAIVDFIFLADLARYYRIHQVLLPELLPILPSFRYVGDLTRSTEWRNIFEDNDLKDCITDEQSNITDYKVRTLTDLLNFFERGSDEESTQKKQVFQDYVKAITLFLDSLVMQREYMLKEDLTI